MPLIRTAGGGKDFNQPNFPNAVVDGSYFSLDKRAIQHNGTLIDTVRMPATANSGTFDGMLNGSVVWTVTRTDVNASTNNWFASGCSIWYDDINDRLYVFALDTTTTPDTLYTAYITLETGAVTNVGNVQLTTDINSPTSIGVACCYRSAIDSGDFTFYHADRTVVIDESDGSEVSNTARTDPFPAAPSFAATYVTDDQEIFTGIYTVDYIQISSNSLSAVIRSPINEHMYGTGASLVLYATRWGDKVKFFSDNSNRYNIKTANQSDYDKFVHDMAKFAGLE